MPTPYHLEPDPCQYTTDERYKALLAIGVECMNIALGEGQALAEAIAWTIDQLGEEWREDHAGEEWRAIDWALEELANLYPSPAWTA